MLPKKLKSYLDESGKNYEVIHHRTVYTAYDAAATMKVELSEVVKVLLVKVDKPVVGWPKAFALACVSANRNLDFKKLAQVMNQYIMRETPRAASVIRVKKVEIPKENVMHKVFKVAPGSMHAFGSLYRLPVFVDKGITKLTKAVFPGGSFMESFKMKVADFTTLEHVIVGAFSVSKKIKKR